MKHEHTLMTQKFSGEYVLETSRIHQEAQPERIVRTWEASKYPLENLGSLVYTLGGERVKHATWERQKHCIHIASVCKPQQQHTKSH